MRHELRLRLRQAAVVTAGGATLLGSGGGFPPFELNLNEITPWVVAEMQPGRQTVQVGSTVRFVVQTLHATRPSFQWCRLPSGGATCETIAGVTGDTYTLASANLADDGATYIVSISDPNGSAYAKGMLFVSSMPPVTYRDTDFATGDWSVTTWADPPTGGPSATVTTQAGGGNPGAYRETTIQVPLVPSALRIFQTSMTARYDPTTQGAIHVIDATEDCVTPGTSTSNAYIGTVPLLEQAGRRYVATDPWSRGCSGADTWFAVMPRIALTAQDFVIAEGPACAVGEACPDFGASGALIGLGFAQLIQASAGGTPGTRTRGIDNWTMTIWRR